MISNIGVTTNLLQQTNNNDKNNKRTKLTKLTKLTNKQTYIWNNILSFKTPVMAPKTTKSCLNLQIKTIQLNLSY